MKVENICSLSFINFAKVSAAAWVYSCNSLFSPDGPDILNAFGRQLGKSVQCTLIGPLVYDIRYSQMKVINKKTFYQEIYIWLIYCLSLGIVAVSIKVKEFCLGLSTQSWARDNTAATMWPCFQATMLLCIFSLWQLNLVTEILKSVPRTYFSCLWSSISLTRYRCLKGIQLSRAQLCILVRKLLTWTGWPQAAGQLVGRVDVSHNLPVLLHGLHFVFWICLGLITKPLLLFYLIKITQVHITM